VELTKRLIGLIKRRMECGFAVTVSETDFHQIAPPVWMKGGPSLIGYMYALSGVSAWCGHHSFDGLVSYFYEKGDEHEAVFNEMIERMSELHVVPLIV
jgi:hypothetical protein